MRRVLFLTTLLFAVVQASAWAGRVEDAKALLNARRYGEALPLLQRSAAGGNAEGEFYLGLMYEIGWGTAQDYAQARQWYEKSAASGESDAANELGIFYQNGWGVGQDYAQ